MPKQKQIHNAKIFRAELLRLTTEADIKKMMKRLKAAAHGGDVDAIRTYLDIALGGTPDTWGDDDNPD